MKKLESDHHLGTGAIGARYRTLANWNLDMSALPPHERPIEKSTDAARQGVTGHNVRYVLAISLGAAVVILGCIWFAFFGR
jgi:hypothetical protein